MRTPSGADSPAALRRPRSGTNGRVILLILMLGLGLGLVMRYRSANDTGPAPDPTPPASPPVSDGPPTPNVHVALHLDEPLAAEKTSVWTVAFQAAWDQMADSMKLKDGIRLAPPARPEAVRALNAGRLPPGVVDPDDLTVIAGVDSDALWAEVDGASDRPRPVYEEVPGNPGIVAFARLRASLRYETPFFVAERPLAFGPEQTEVTAWGLRADAEGPVPSRMRAQARIHVPEGTPDEEIARRSVVVLTSRDGKRLVLSMRTPKETLGATWRDAASTLASTESREFQMVDALTIPRVALVAERSFDEIAPAVFEGTDQRLVVAQQHVSLTVDERGADVDAEAVMVAVGAIPLVVEFDRPFLVAILANGSETPYVLAWIGSADALSRWGAPVGRALAADEVPPFVGSWTIDESASIEATLAAWKRLLIHRRDLIDRRRVSGFLGDWAFELVVAEDGEASVRSHPPGLREQRATVPLRRDGARVLLALPWGDGGGSRTWVVSRHEDQLHLSIPSQGMRLVLRRAP